MDKDRTIVALYVWIKLKPSLFQKDKYYERKII